MLSAVLVDIATNQGACTPLSPSASNCQFPLNYFIGRASLPDIFVSAIKAPFFYSPAIDEHGYLLAFMIFFSPVSIFIATIAANFWVWRLHSVRKGLV